MPNALPDRLRNSLYKTAVPVPVVVPVMPIVATLLAIWLLSQRAVHPLDLALLAVMYALAAFGVTVGYHRMRIHRSFRPHPAVKAALLILGSLAVEGPATVWAATHTKHDGHGR